MGEQVILDIRGLNKDFPMDGGSVHVLDDIDLSVKRGEFVSVVGFSGCGKSTLLRIISGLDRKTSGSLMLDGKEIEAPGPERGMIFQESRLFPWMTVRDNVRYGLSREKQRELGKQRVQEVVREYIKLVKLDDFAKAYPRQLSGGMQQRVSIARSLIAEPELLLLDEPFGALDAITRIGMQEETLRIWQEDKKTMILVTHDIDEAVYLSDRIVVLSQKPGHIKKIVDVPLPRPRKRTGIEFSEVRREVFKLFFEESEDKEIEYYI